MQHRWKFLACSVLALALVGGPIAADDFTGSEAQVEDIPCDSSNRPDHPHDAPQPGDCQDLQNNPDQTYRGRVWRNDVQCNSGGQDIGIGQLYYVADQGDQEGGVGVCNDGSGAAPIQGRVVLYGSFEHEGFMVYADGDKDNTQHEQAQGWARGDLTTDGPEVRCGDDGGKKDASDPGPGDTQDNCGP